MRIIPLRHFTIAYVAALLLIALVAGATHWIVDRIARDQAIFTSQIEIAARQPMLVQRAAFLVSRLTDGPDDERTPARIELGQAIDKMEDIHKALIAGTELDGIELYQSNNVDRLYFEPPINLDQQVRRFIGLARALIDMPDDGLATADTTISELMAEANGNLPVNLEAAVSIYEAEARTHVARLRHILAVMLGLLIATLVAEALLLFRPLFIRVRDQQQTLLDMARTDPLTNSHNRRSFIALAEAEHARIRRSGKPASLLMLDIDKFKNINDSYGHGVGDEAIRDMADTCLANLRGADFLGRIGGEEFCIVLPDTNERDALQAAEKIRAAIEASETDAGGGTKISFTVSIGLAEIRQDSDSLHKVMEIADTRLYAAKQGGRNRVVGSDGGTDG